MKTKIAAAVAAFGYLVCMLTVAVIAAGAAT
jgi:hypothetical protein